MELLQRKRKTGEDTGNYFVKVLGFSLEPGSGERQDIKKYLSGHTELAISTQKMEAFGEDKVVLSGDCISDYHLLRKLGVQFLGQLNYCKEGIAINFVDSKGNRYVLLEMRDYSYSNI